MKNYLILSIVCFAIFSCTLPEQKATSTGPIAPSERLEKPAIYKLPDMGLQFESEVILELDDDIDSSIIFEGEDIDLDFDMFSAEEQTDAFLEDIKTGTRDLVVGNDTLNIEDIGPLPFIPNSYCVKSKSEYNNRLIPVYDIGIYDKEKQRAFEITVWCWNGHAKAGLDAIMSLKPLK